MGVLPAGSSTRFSRENQTLESDTEHRGEPNDSAESTVSTFRENHSAEPAVSTFREHRSAEPSGPRRSKSPARNRSRRPFLERDVRGGQHDALRDPIAAFDGHVGIRHVQHLDEDFVLRSRIVWINYADAVRHHQPPFQRRAAAREHAEKVSFRNLDDQSGGHQPNLVRRNEDVLACGEIESRCVGGLVGWQRHRGIESSNANVHANLVVKIYLACTVRGDRASVAALKEACARLQALGHDVLTAHLLEENVDAREAMLTEREVYARDIDWLTACDALVADGSGSSFGVGFEVGYVLARAPQTRQRVFLLYDARRRGSISRMITGLTDPNCTVVPYQTPSELVEFIDANF